MSGAAPPPPPPLPRDLATADPPCAAERDSGDGAAAPATGDGDGGGVFGVVPAASLPAQNLVAPSEGRYSKRVISKPPATDDFAVFVDSSVVKNLGRRRKVAQKRYEVETIVDRRPANDKSNANEYLVKWVGYPSAENTWEPETGLSGAKQAIRQFEARLKSSDSKVASNTLSETTGDAKTRAAESDPAMPATRKRASKQMWTAEELSLFQQIMRSEGPGRWDFKASKLGTGRKGVALAQKWAVLQKQNVQRARALPVTAQPCSKDTAGKLLNCATNAPLEGAATDHCNEPLAIAPAGLIHGKTATLAVSKGVASSKKTEGRGARALQPRKRKRQQMVEKEDDYCFMCGDGGELVCCEGCPRVFHSKCLNDHAPGHAEQPKFQGKKHKWFCPECPSKHVAYCAECGMPGSSERRLIPCRECRRAVHARCCRGVLAHIGWGMGPWIGCDDQVTASQNEDREHDGVDAHRPIGGLESRMAMHCASEGEWTCGRCCAHKEMGREPPEDKLVQPAEVHACRAIAQIGSKFPPTHFLSMMSSQAATVCRLLEACHRMRLPLTGMPGMPNGDFAAVIERLQFLIYAQTSDVTNFEAADRGSCSATSLSSLSPLAGQSVLDDEKTSGYARQQNIVDGEWLQPKLWIAEPHEDLPKMSRGFFRTGLSIPCAATHCCPPLSEDQVAELLELTLSYYNAVIRTINTLQLQEELEGEGFTSFKLRCAGRYDMVVPEIECMDYLSDERAPWMRLVRSILGPTATRIHCGCMLSLPGSKTQNWHMDGDHISESTQYAPHCLNVFLPLVDLTPEVGPTEMMPGSHLDWEGVGTEHRCIAPRVDAGSYLLFDYRLRHRGLGNRSSGTLRPLIYLTYAKPWFKDSYNFSRKRYRDLPPLVAERAGRPSVVDQTNQNTSKGDRSTDADVGDITSELATKNNARRETSEIVVDQANLADFT